METVTQQIPLIKKSSSYKITIPDNVEDIIRYTCQKIHNVEWSGVLFYTIEGSFEENNLNVICKDIYIMDIGSSTYTEFDMSPDVVGYMAENPELFNYYTALIHSHNNMATI